ncbi:hypothetical protein [Desulfofundulus sp.]|uniref:hypothetical protein n=1 Tax=Desulfofundulus sp. TaxID=2282750 RepID=UPI003C754CD6
MDKEGHHTPFYLNMSIATIFTGTGIMSGTAGGFLALDWYALNYGYSSVVRG